MPKNKIWNEQEAVFEQKAVMGSVSNSLAYQIEGKRKNKENGDNLATFCLLIF